MKRVCLLAVLWLAVWLGAPASGIQKEVEPGPIPPPPAGMPEDYGFSRLDRQTMELLLSQGSVLVVRQRPDLTLIDVTAGALVDAPVETVWDVITDFEHYAEIMPQTDREVVLRRDGNKVLAEQTIGVKIWRLPSVDITYRLAHVLYPKTRLRFYHVSGQLEGTYGGWDLVPAGDKTMAFYTLYSNLTALGWGLGAIFRSQPDFMAGVNVTTAMMVTKAVKEESEKRAGR